MKELITYNNPKSPISEAYRGIRTNLLFANVDDNIKTILVTSSTPGEGKTTTLINIANVIVGSGQKTLILDCDMRKPRIHKVISGISNINGLSELLLSGNDYRAYIQNNEEVNIDIITAGKIPSNPSELLHSQAMRNLIDKIRQDYDYIFIDTPPVLPVTDAIVMSNYIDGVILVVVSGQLSREHVIKAKTALKAVDANILGVVLNKMPVSNKKSYQSYYYYQQKKEEA